MVARRYHTIYNCGEYGRQNENLQPIARIARGGDDMAVAGPRPSDNLRFVSLEITGKCQLACTHCYSDSGPGGTRGSMTNNDWLRIIDETAELHIPLVQFIGGEPSLHPDLPKLVNHALDRGLEVEIYTNLVRVTDKLWQIYRRSGVRLATSYYSSEAARHNSVTGRRSHDRTLMNIQKALDLGLRLRVGVIDVEEEQRAHAAVEQLQSIGVSYIRYDRLRQIGRGEQVHSAALNQLCGRCGCGHLAVSPDGEVWPCGLARWITLGSVQTAGLLDVYQNSLPQRSSMHEIMSTRIQTDPDGGCANPSCIPPLPSR
jgi:MoaA/NifB/PqqE/SkfB family radical SAM enzyme